MTMPRTTTLLISFTSKIEEAVVLVPRMGVTEKLKAVQFWNVVSEKLQDIVNKNAADINAVALKMDDSDANELCLEMSHLSDAMNPLNNTSDFINTPPTSTIYNEFNSQFHNADLQSSHLKQEFSSELITTNSEPLHTQVEISQMSEIHHINQDTDDMPQNKTQNSSHQLHDSLSLSSAYNSHANEPQPEHSTAYHEGNSSYSLKPNSTQSSPNKRQRIQPSRQIKKERSEITIDTHSSNEMNLLKQALMKGSSKLNSSSNFKKRNTKTVNDSEDSLSAGDLEPHVDLEELDEENPEHIVSLGNSNSEEFLEDRLQEINKKNTDIDSAHDCTVCGKQFSNPTALKQHGIIHKKSFSCSECTSVFATNTKLIVHMRRHTGEKPYACHQCSACFSTQGNLKRHVMAHDGVKPWKCSECDSCFTEKKSLTIHMRRHTGERPYKCKICGKGFTQAGVLESHMAMHLGIKKHLCEKCGKAFRQKSQLRVHRLRHENVKRFKCDACSMLFLTKADLERHGKTHSGEKPYVCEVCSKRFTRQQSLNEHLNRHYGIKPYTCEHCGKKFVEMSSFYKHLKFHNKATTTGDLTKVDSNNHEIPKTEDHVPRLEISNTENVMPLLKAKNTENSMSSMEEGTQYIAVVLNGEETHEVQNINNQTILCNSENSNVTNNFGVLTSINLVPNASIMPAGYLS